MLILLLVIMLLPIAAIHVFFTAMWSIFYKIKINNLLENINGKEDIFDTEHKDFINIVLEVLRRKGFKAKITDKCGEENNGFILDNIQLVEVWKYSLNHTVDVEAAMKLAKCMQSNSIYRGMLITLGDFKKNTIMFCHKNVIECINGDRFLAMCREVQKKREALPAD